MKLHQWIILLFTGLLLAACNTTATQIAPAVQDLLPPQVAAEIQNQVSETLGVSLEDIQITGVEQMEWPDSCLGLGQANESCAQVVTPGWLVVFTIKGEEFRYRVNETGTMIRQEP